MEKKKFVVPHVYILLLALILVFSLLSYVIPSNVYDYHDVVVNPETGQTRSVVDPETYHAVDPTPVSLMQFLTAVPRGMQESAQIIFFIFLVGGALAVLQETRAIEAGRGRMIKAMKSKTLFNSTHPVSMLNEQALASYFIIVSSKRLLCGYGL